ncbi:mediator complex, subunit Med5 [Nadsonia fulvescens var. elongata DSM 6958]|uniref:Mediator of RNA polymerase II transcription subunit 5 n=1 Tax=Nadsonia fulvescens var. elongata DSM 6958 TaxID=857566 RepID=A0A1E3PEJ0_9ASCO|nr:mediator complex, subunit Med5 [Nadsonia fulvescens var. elongata DSM 6958]
MSAEVIFLEKKLENLTRGCVRRGVSAEKFLKLIKLLPEKVTANHIKFTESVLAARTSLFVDPDICVYLAYLAFQEDSTLPLNKLLEYLRTVNEPSQPQILIFLANSLRSWENASFETLIETLKALTLYMNDANDKSSLLWSFNGTNGVIALGTLISELGKYKIFAPIFDSELTNELSERNYRSDFRVAIQEFVKILKELESYFESEISLYYNLTGGSTANSISSATALTGTITKPSRVFRFMWLESLMLSSSYIQSESLVVQIKQLLGNESPQKLVSDLIMTSFDCLVISLSRKDPAKYHNLWRAFIIKKLPDLIRSILHTNNQHSEQVITQPIHSLDSCTVSLLRTNGDNNGDALDEMFSSFPATSSDIRHEFLKACIALKLISTKAYYHTLGEDAAVDEDFTAIEIDDGTNYTMIDESNGSGLVIPISEFVTSICQENFEFIGLEDSKIWKLIVSFETMEGPKQANISKSLLDLWKQMISSEDWRLVRYFSQSLCLNISSLDALVLHIPPAQFLNPLLEVVESWVDDEDEMNFQDTYTDFGCMLLFITTLYQRYNLTIPRTAKQPSFVYNMLHDSVDVNTLATQASDYLGGWITALFDAGGISDDLMRSATIKDCYKLVPVIFQQAIMASEKGLLDTDTLKGGLEYFLQPFLLGTLISTFRWLSSYLWLSTDVTVALRIIQSLVLTSELTNDISPIHKMVLAVSADDIYFALKDLIQRDIHVDSNLVDALSSYLSVHHRPLNPLFEEENNPGVMIGGGSGSRGRNAQIPPTSSILSIAKSQLSGLASWLNAVESQNHQGNTAVGNSSSLTPPFYNSKYLSLAINLLGPETVLDSFVNEILANASQDNDHVNIEVLSAVIVTIKPSKFSKNTLIQLLNDRNAVLSKMNDGGSNHKESKAENIRITALNKRVNELKVWCRDMVLVGCNKPDNTAAICPSTVQSPFEEDKMEE